MWDSAFARRELGVDMTHESSSSVLWNLGEAPPNLMMLLLLPSPENNVVAVAAPVAIAVASGCPGESRHHQGRYVLVQIHHAGRSGELTLLVRLVMMEVHAPRPLMLLVAEAAWAPLDNRVVVGVRLVVAEVSRTVLVLRIGTLVVVVLVVVVVW